MDILGSLVVFAILAISAHIYVKKKKIEIAAKINPVNNKDLTVLQDELQRRTKIKERVETFLKESKFFDPIATWRDEKIYKYVFNGGYLYEFDEIMPDSNQRIGVDDDFLCFKQLNYKRVNNPEQFLEKFKNEVISITA